MPDDKSNTGGQDRKRISLSQDYEVQDWCRSLDTTPEKLQEAVHAVGDQADRVREYLNKERPKG
jgi:hypothetical protein